MEGPEAVVGGEGPLAPGHSNRGNVNRVTGLSGENLVSVPTGSDRETFTCVT